MAELAALQSELASLAELEKEIDTELDTMEVDNEDEGESGEECEVRSSHHLTFWAFTCYSGTLISFSAGE